MSTKQEIAAAASKRFKSEEVDMGGGVKLTLRELSSSERKALDERLWKKLEPKRRARRKVRPRPSRKGLKKLDLLEFAKARPPQDCIGERSGPQ